MDSLRRKYLQNRNNFYLGKELTRTPNEKKNEIMINNKSQKNILNSAINKNRSENLNLTNSKSQIKIINSNNNNKPKVLNLTNSNSQIKLLNTPTNKINNKAHILNLNNNNSHNRSTYVSNYNTYLTNTKSISNNNSQIELLKHTNPSDAISLTNYNNYNKKRMINNNNNSIPIRKLFTNTNSSVEKSRINDKTHKENLKMIETLKKELNDIEKENRFISKEINILKNTERFQLKDLNKINNDINKQQLELNKLKDLYKTKNQKYIQLLNTHRQMLIDNIRNIQRDTTNEINRQSIHHFFDRLNFLYNMRRENNSNEGPSMSDDQIQALPISYYPRNNNSDEKCVICGFPFCYNDVIIKLRSCNHIFHKACLINTLTINRSSVCPICRVSII